MRLDRQSDVAHPALEHRSLACGKPFGCRTSANATRP
jgi:hypothetical protein